MVGACAHSAAVTPLPDGTPEQTPPPETTAIEAPSDAVTDADLSQRARLERAVQTFHDAFVKSDFETALGFMPPRAVTFFAQQTNQTPDEFLRTMAQATEKMAKEVEFESFNMDLSSAKFAETAEGRAYAMIPTTTKMRMNPNDDWMEVFSQTAAFIDGGKWYLLRIENDAHAMMLRQLYPDFEGVNLSP
jgi:hypothetical protein